MECDDRHLPFDVVAFRLQNRPSSASADLMLRSLATVALLVLLITLYGCRFDASPGTTVTMPADSAAGEVSFELEGQGGAALVVPVHINDAGPFDFVLDTGATFTCINESLVDSLELPGQGGQIGLGAGVGSAGRVRLVALDSLRVGNARAYDLTACALDLASLQQLDLQIDGLVGLNFLKEFQIMLDFDRQIVRFSP